MAFSSAGRQIGTVLLIVIGLLGLPVSTPAQSRSESSELAEGWALLATGPAAEVSRFAEALVLRFPRSVSVYALALEAELQRAGAGAGLDHYERWLAGRTLEEPGVVRRLALAVLREAVAQSRANPAGLEALKALSEDGDTAGTAALAAGVGGGSAPEARMLAAQGDERGVDALLGTFSSTPGFSPSLETVKALGASRRPNAFPALMTLAQSADPVIRQAAIAALGAFGDSRALPLLRQALKDPSGMAQGQAAAALYRLGDNSGLGLIEALATSEAPAGRIAAAHYLSSRPDGRWFGLLDDLSAPGRPAEVRLAAAKLLTPHRPADAAAILRSIGESSTVDLAVREEAWRSEPAALGSDLRALRALLRHPDALARVAAAEGVLRVTR